MGRSLAALVLVSLALAACGGAPSPGSGATPLPSASAARKEVPAPIDALEIRRVAALRYSAHIRAGLPSGCAQKDRYETSRKGDVIEITVLNTIPTGDVICTMIYGTYELDVDLGADLRAGTTYTVRVNDKTATFTAQ